VTFLEDDFIQKKAGQQWYNVITGKYPFLDAHKVHYNTSTTKSLPRFLDHPERWHELDLRPQLTDEILNTKWDVILVTPRGYSSHHGCTLFRWTLLWDVVIPVLGGLCRFTLPCC
jgi:hypothetical protein